MASREGGCPGDPAGPQWWRLALRLVWGLAEHPGGTLGPFSLGATPCSCLEVEEQKEGGYGLTLGFGVSKTLRSERRDLRAHFPPFQPLGRGCSVGPIQGRSPGIGEVHARAHARCLSQGFGVTAMVPVPLSSALGSQRLPPGLFAEV